MVTASQVTPQTIALILLLNWPPEDHWVIPPVCSLPPPQGPELWSAACHRLVHPTPGPILREAKRNGPSLAFICHLCSNVTAYSLVANESHVNDHRIQLL